MVLETISHIIVLALVVIYLVSFWIYSSLVKKAYGGRMTSAIPYFLLGIGLLTGMFLLEALEVFYAALDETHFFHFSLQIIQLLAGIFFISGLYNLYQTAFAVGELK